MKKLVPLLLLIATTSAYGLCFYGPESIPPGEVIWYVNDQSDFCKPYPTVQTTKIEDRGFRMCEGFGQKVPEGFYVRYKNSSSTSGCGCLLPMVWRGTYSCHKYRATMDISKR